MPSIKLSKIKGNPLDFQSIETSNFTAESTKMYMVNALSTTIVITLPVLAEGDTLVFHSLNTSTQNVQIDNTGVEVVGVGGTIAAGDNLELTAGQSVQLVAVSPTVLTLVGGVV